MRELNIQKIKMNEKSNQATPLRPKGDRLLDAPLVEMDLNQFMTQITSEVTWKEGDRNTITVYKSPKLRIVLIGLKKNAILKRHTAPGHISVQTLKGHIVFNTMKQDVNLKQGQMLSLQPKIPHEVSAVEESFFLLTMAMP